MCLQDPDNSHEITQGRLELLKRLTSIPTATGREQRVSDFIREWVALRPELKLSEDRAGNLVVSMGPVRGGTSAKVKKGKKAPAPKGPPLFITAHLDHPAFVIEAIDKATGRLELSFRGGVNDVFFEHAPIIVHTSKGPISGTLTGPSGNSSGAGKHYWAEIDQPGDEKPVVGDLATWALPGPEIDAQGILHTPACDDLAAAAASLCAMDSLLKLRRHGQPLGDVRLLFTLAEEIGFIGAIAACRLKTIPKGSVLLALENSRAFPESPLGGGPIVRVGDRLTIFTPWVTAACSARAEATFGGASAPTASQTLAQAAKRPWQRKLMAGGACEASVFCHYGFDATCLCLPLGNYHNMPHLEKLQAGTYDATTLGPPRCEREYIHTQDYLGLVDLLVALGVEPPRNDQGDFGTRLDKMFAEKKYVLDRKTGDRPKVATSKPAKAARKGVTKPKRRRTP